MAAFYNEHESYAAEWLRRLIAAGLIAEGVVDERSIEDIDPKELEGFTQCHFFAGIGGWSYALRLAGVPDDFAVWTGSCPCQPFSTAGKQRAADDERHLWPAFFNLIRECRPGIVFGEQVAGNAGYVWWDSVATDLEGEGYAVAAADLGAHSVGAPHIRQRLYWLADAGCGRMGDAISAGLEGHRPYQTESGWSGAPRPVAEASSANPWNNVIWLPCADGKVRPTQPGLFPLAHGASARMGRLRAYGNAIVPQVAEVFIRACME